MAREYKPKPYRGYLGNPNLKKPFEQIAFTQEQVDELRKCKDDLFYFVNNYVHIEIPGKGIKSIKEVGLWPRQIDMLTNLRDNRFNVFKIPRQSAKTTTIAIYYSWCALFNESEKIGILANKAKLACEIVGKFKVIIEKLPLFLQQGILEYNKGNIALENGSEIKAEACSEDPFRGFSMTKVLMDELSFVGYELADKIYESLYPTISRAENSQFSIASTPKGINNLFYKMWMDAIAKKNDFVPLEIKWWEVPRKDQEAFKNQTIRNIGMTRWRQEFLCEFLAQSNSLIQPDAFERIVRHEPIEIKGDFRKFAEPVCDVKESDGKIKKGKKYVITVDSSEGVGGDNSALVITNISDYPYQVVGTFKNNTTDPTLYAAMVVELARYYNKASLLIENNSIGYAVADSIITDYEYDNIIYIKTVNGVERVSNGYGKSASSCLRTTVKTKALGCSALKTLIEEGNLQINDENVFKELVSFVATGNSFAATEGATDDLVMCLVMFAWLTKQDFFQDLINDSYTSFFDIGGEDEIDTPEKMLIKHYDQPASKAVEQIEKDENLLPFGYVPSSVNSDDDEFDWNW